MADLALIDGWALRYAPNSPAALHALEWLSVQGGVLALPGECFHALPAGVETVRLDTAEEGRLGWEQRSLPRLARQAGATALHSLGGGPPLLARLPCWYHPARFPDEQPALHGQAARWREALAQGGRARAGLIWPADLPAPSGAGRVQTHAPGVLPAFFAPQAAALAGVDAPADYVLYHGAGDAGSLQRLLAVWRWAADSVGQNDPLLAVGLSAPEQQRLRQLAAQMELSESVLCLPPQPLAVLAALYGQARLVLHPLEPATWGDPIRMALAAGRPLVALETPATAALTGAAAYLAPADQPRLLAAALISILVEEALAEQLSQQARQQAERWRMPAAHGA